MCADKRYYCMFMYSTAFGMDKYQYWHIQRALVLFHQRNKIGSMLLSPITHILHMYEMLYIL